MDVFTKASFQFEKGLATAVCGLEIKADGRLLIAGTKGYIVAEAPWWKTTYFEVHYEDVKMVEKYSERYLEDGLGYEISDFLRRINRSEETNFRLTRGESIAIAGVMERFLKEEGRENEDMGA